MSKLEVLHGGLTALALLVATIALGGVPALFEKAGIVLLRVVAFSVLSWIALGFLLPGARRSDSHWRAPLSNAVGNRLMGIALRAPFYLLAVTLVVVVILGYLSAR
ncbi:hypothetical protein [Noviluteimonas gilva]|uniref:Uncharacterized protein n=1 Tax=Noviluteimonas gilva TaxID=2682097 RepID=A0A7C9LI52_9GAMM|nr:hypothetical protein [Lysobacter gilvus]MUV14600.1 hypothetical protein [Lysobacter gilvus]